MKVSLSLRAATNRLRPRLPQKADLSNDLPEPDDNNLGLVLNRLRRDPVVKETLLEFLMAAAGGRDYLGALASVRGEHVVQ